MNTTTDSVRIVVENDNASDEFLIVSEIDDPDNYKLPGGKFNNTSESPFDAAKRELKEELNIEDYSTLLPAAELLNDDGMSKRFIFELKVKTDSITPSSEISTVKWVNVTKVPECKNKSHILAAVHSCIL